MIDRASTFSNPEIIQKLKTDFIPVAIDQAYQRRQKDTEGEFYRLIASQSPRNNFQSTTQGLYVAAPDGHFLGFTNNRDPRRVFNLLSESLESFRKTDRIYDKLEVKSVDVRYNPDPPEGGLILRVQAKVLDGYEAGASSRQKIFQEAVSRDNLWVTAGEKEALINGSFPEILAKRIARFHLVDNTRGEPPMWKNHEIQSLRINMQNGVISGHFHLKTRDGERYFSGELSGLIEAEKDSISSLNIAAFGRFFGDGPYTGNAPAGEFTLAVSLTLADGSDVADSIPPQGSRGWVDGYLNPR